MENSLFDFFVSFQLSLSHKGSSDRLGLFNIQCGCGWWSKHHIYVHHSQTTPNTTVSYTGMNSWGQSGQHRVYIDRVGHWPSFLSLIPGKSYKLRTSETCDVSGHDLS